MWTYRDTEVSRYTAVRLLSPYSRFFIVVDYLKLPHQPGCYLFKDAAGKVIYVGKAKDLRKRVSSYFKEDIIDPKTAAMVSHVAEVDYFVAGNEKEALILENNLIKKYLPKYNIRLRDSKRYAYVMLSEEKFPRLAMARRREEKGEYFGPFPSAEKRDSLLRFASNVFRLRTCRRLPKKQCLRHHMGRCTAPCVGGVSEEAYLRQVEDARRMLSGKDTQLLEDLRKRMSSASQRKDFEAAAVFRDQIAAIESLLEKQRMESNRGYDYDVVNFILFDETVYLAVFHAKSGVLLGKDEYAFPEKEDFFEEFLLQYYSETDVPKEVILPEKVSEALAEVLSEKRGKQVVFSVPARGEKKSLLDLVAKNLEASFLEADLMAADLQEKLGLEKKPKTIECFDVSHTGGSDSVGSMVRFVDGKPDKGGYRRFKIRSVEGVDDPAMMAELVRRRYGRLKEEKKDLPDLVVVDGGAAQVAAAFKELRKLGLRIPLAGLAKRNEEVYFPGFAEPVGFDRRSRAVKLLQQVRDEAHRFAVSYHKVLRKKRVLGNRKV